MNIEARAEPSRPEALYLNGRKNFRTGKPSGGYSLSILSENKSLHARLDMSDRGIVAVAALVSAVLLSTAVLVLASL